MVQVLFGNLMDREASFDTMCQLLISNGRAFVVLTGCLIALSLLKGSAASRHFLICSAIISILLLPFSSQFIPAVNIVIDTKEPEVEQALHNTRAPAIMTEHFTIANSLETRDYFYQVFIIVYQIVSILILIKILVDNLKMFLFIKVCQPVKQKYWLEALNKCQNELSLTRKVTIKHSHLIHSPSTWGAFRPTILIPTSALQWPDHLIKSTLLHELAHIKRYDWLSQQITRCICSLHWINPLCWLAHKKLCSYAEKSCDDIALNAGVKNTHYANDLINVAEHVLVYKKYNYAALSMAASSIRGQLANRILAILNPRGEHIPIKQSQVILTLFTVVFLLVPMASIRANYVEEDKPSFPIYSHENTKEFPLVIQDYDPLPNTTETPKTPFILEDYKKMALRDKTKIQLTKFERKELTPISTSNAFKRMANKISNTILDKNHQLFPVKIKEPSLPKLTNDNKTITTINQNDTLFSHNNIEQHSYKNMVTPKYPHLARLKGIEGEVQVQYSIDELGQVTEAKIISATPSKIFDNPALKAIKKSKFNPRKVNGKAVAAINLTEKYIFILKS